MGGINRQTPQPGVHNASTRTAKSSISTGIVNQRRLTPLRNLLCGICYALTEPAEKKLVARFAADGEAGAAFGWFHTVLGIANLPSSLLFGWLYQSFGPMVAFGWGALAAIIAAALLTNVGSGKTL